MRCLERTFLLEDFCPGAFFNTKSFSTKENSFSWKASPETSGDAFFFELSI